MKLELTFLRSKVAQRIFFLFISCALLPISIMAVVSLTTITKELRDQSQERIRLTGHTMSQAIYERFELLIDDMKVIASNMMANPEPDLLLYPSRS